MPSPADGKRLALDNVTLVAISSVALAATVRALRLSLEQVAFGEALLLSHVRPPELAGSEIRWAEIAPITSRSAYSRFVLTQLAGHVKTDYALLVQWDGYVRDSRMWRREFLEYDYIGAVWPHVAESRCVGNGGFSLRSRRLLELAARLPGRYDRAEDVLICQTHRDWLEQEHGIRFAPPSLARGFSYERTAPRGDEFGFHGVFNMQREMSSRAFAELLGTIEPGAIGRRESGEVLAAALRRPSLRVLRQAWRHRFGH